MHHLQPLLCHYCEEFYETLNQYLVRQILKEGYTMSLSDSMLICGLFFPGVKMVESGAK